MGVGEGEDRHLKTQEDRLNNCCRIYAIAAPSFHADRTSPRKDCWTRRVSGPHPPESVPPAPWALQKNLPTNFKKKKTSKLNLNKIKSAFYRIYIIKFLLFSILILLEYIKRGREILYCQIIFSTKLLGFLSHICVCPFIIFLPGFYL